MLNHDCAKKSCVYQQHIKNSSISYWPWIFHSRTIDESKCFTKTLDKLNNLLQSIIFSIITALAATRLQSTGCLLSDNRNTTDYSTKWKWETFSLVFLSLAGELCSKVSRRLYWVFPIIVLTMFGVFGMLLRSGCFLFIFCIDEAV